ncbi:MAG: PKD domain-containing protein [Bacteroidales bacterium]|jgi:PKD repeat protein|nr:PKD domain-containing protein [Bacteroidales bacterium]
MKNFTFLLFILIILGVNTNSYSQRSYGGLPVSYTLKSLNNDIDHIMLPRPDINSIKQEDYENDKNGGMHRVGYIIPVKYNMNNSGTWDVLEDGTHVWRFKITCPDALALTMLYKEFYLPEGTQLFLYNENRKQLLGSYDHRTNPESGDSFSTQMIQGETTYIEYIKPENVSEEAIIDIEGVVYNYRNVEQFVGHYESHKATSFGSSGSCNVNINCPEGNNWQTQKKGVAVIYVIEGGMAGFCSGTIVNNTSNDGTPYMLTADHCGGTATTSEFNQWQFHFNFEATGCSNPATAPSVTSSTVTGCTFKSRGPNGAGGTDFLLLELNTTETALAGMNVYYNGWDRNTTASSSGVSIHHPSGDIKKVSTYTATLQSGTFNSCISNGHWRANWASTATNWGITEGGSSGSPIFNGANKLVIGTLSGGASDCGVPAAQAYDLYGKFDIHWEGNGTSNDRKLKPWLDPGNTGVMTCPGYDPNSGSLPPVANFSGTPTTIDVGGVVNFTDLSTNTPTTWSWTFDGGTPSTSTVQNPSVIYNAPGVYSVSLTVSNGSGTSTPETKSGYIIVNSTGNCSNDLLAAFVASIYEVTAGQDCINFDDQSTGNVNNWSWSFPGAVTTSSTDRSPRNICYNVAGTYDVILEVRCGEYRNTTICEDCITVLPDPEAPIADFDADYIVVPVGSVVHFTNLSQNGPFDQWVWNFEGGLPETYNQETPPPVAYNTVGSFDVSLRCRKTNGRQDVKLKERFIKVVPQATTPPIADFEANYTVIAPGETINFIDFSTGTPHRWNWTFEGGQPATSNRQFPTGITYARAGVYSVTLSVSNNIGTDALTKQMYILVTTTDTCSNAPQANFTAQNRLIEAEGTVYFQNLTTGNPTYCMWEFQGGTPSYSTEQTPSQPVKYNTPGIYKVKLTTSNNCGSTALTKDKYIYVFSGLVPSYCDTITTVRSGETYGPIEYPSSYYGYISGHNGRKIRNFANYFEYYTFNEINALLLPVYEAEAGDSTSYVDFCIWEPDGRRPASEPYARKRIYIKDLATNNQNNFIKFDAPIHIDGPFYAGFRLNYPDKDSNGVSDDLFVTGMVTNRAVNDTTTNTMFFYQGGTWKSTNELFGFSSSLVIRPISCLVDIPSNISENNIDIYPNPTSGIINIIIPDESVKNFYIEIYDALGRKHDAKYTNTGTNEYSININNYPEGLYVVKVIYGSSVATKKILLTK